jgi:hypothetical protein
LLRNKEGKGGDNVCWALVKCGYGLRMEMEMWILVVFDDAGDLGVLIDCWLGLGKGGGREG